MKKLTFVLIGALGVAIVSCGPSAEEKAAAEKARQDSVAAAVQKAVEDSMMMVQAAEKAREDSLNRVMEQMKADSLAQAEAAKKKVAPKKKTNEQKMEEDKKVLQNQKG